MLEIAQQQRLPLPVYKQLVQITESQHALPLGSHVRLLQILALALGGLGVIFMVAANWGVIHHFAMFAILELLVAITCYSAIHLIRFRAALALFGVCGIGALFAFFGQHYQSGAHLWQLFALWSIITLPLALASRSDAVWSSWVIITMSGITSWFMAYNRHRWHLYAPSPVVLTAMLMALAIPITLSKPWRASSGAGPWSQNIGLMSAVSLAASVGTIDIVGSDILTVYWIALMLVGTTAILFSQRALYDVVALSLSLLAVDLLLIAGTIRLVLSERPSSLIAVLVIVAIAVILILGVSAMLITRLHHGYHKEETSHEQAT